VENLTIEQILEAVSGELIVKGNRVDFDHVSTDTRTIHEKSIFIALKGENFNGNNYVVQASQKGAFLCIIDEVNFEATNLKDYTSVIKVADARKALLDLAKYYRSMLDIKVVAITGSTGKTSTKDLTAAVLSSKYKVFKTEGNFNNEIGLPLMIFKLDNSYDIAVLEMGMSNLGEIHNMARAANPDIALITNVGISHIENLKTRENILKAKLEITDFFKDNNVLIVNAENDMLSTVKNKNYKIVKTGLEHTLDMYGRKIKLNEDSVDFKVCDGEKCCDIHLDIPGKHNVYNTLLAMACGKSLDISFDDMKEGIKNLKTTSMRLDIIKGDKATIINDCYNASPDSMKAAIDVLANIKGNNKIAVLGTMRELGDEAYNAHREVALYAKEKGINILITLGEFNKAYNEGFEDSLAFESKEEILNFLSNNIKDKDVVLFKASRAMKFEVMVEELKKHIF